MGQKMHLSRKPSYMMLEIMIAIALVALCALPLAFSPLKALKKELELIERLEMERIADLSFVEIKERLLKNEIPWEELSTSKREKTSYKLSSLSFLIKGSGKRNVERGFRILCPHEKEGYSGIEYRHLLIKVELYLKKKPHEFQYHLFSQRK